MRRKTGELLPIEAAILEAATRMQGQGTDQFYGFAIAREIQEARGARFLTASGKLYRALDRLEGLGYVKSEWEDPAIAAQANRPRRRLYRVIRDADA